MDAVFKALADPSRRRLLDDLRRRDGQSLRELCSGLDMARQSVTKHLAVLEAANLVTTVRRGREKLHYLNAAPLGEIADRWIDKYHRDRVRTLVALKRALEEEPMDKPQFVYVSYIRTSPERLWQALTDPAFISRYFEGTGPESDWQVGSPVRWKSTPEGEFRDLDQVVLESGPPRRLAYTWHTYQPDHAQMFGWTEERLAELQQEERSKVSFEIEPAGEGTVKLTVVHDGFEAETEMLTALRQGWPAILSNLKSLLETGEPLAMATP